MASPETPTLEREFTPQSEAQIALAAKKEIKETLALAPAWKELNPDEQEALAERIFRGTFTIYLNEYERRRQEHTDQAVETA